MKNVTPKLQMLDLSHWTGKVDWDKLSENKDLIAVGWKASEGTYNTDPTYAAARVEATKRGYLWMAYHFGTNDSVTGQVDRFLKSAQPDEHTRMALDWEDYGLKQMAVAQVLEFLGRLDDKLGRRATLYTGNTGREMLGTTRSDFLGEHPLWIPRYASSVASQPVVQVSWDHWDIWQYAADGHGMPPNTPVGTQEQHPDCNVFYDPVEVVRKNWAGPPLTADPVWPKPPVETVQSPADLVVTVTIDAPPGVQVNVMLGSPADPPVASVPKVT